MHLVKKLRGLGYWVRGVDIKRHEWSPTGRTSSSSSTSASRPTAGGAGARWRNLRRGLPARADMAGWVHPLGRTETHHNSALHQHLHDGPGRRLGVPRYFFVVGVRLPRHAARRTGDDGAEAVPAHPDNEYGWEKLYSSGSPRRTNGATDAGAHRAVPELLRARRAWTGRPREGAGGHVPEIAEIEDGGTIEVWGDGSAVRSYTYVSDWSTDLRADTLRAHGAVNIGCPQYVTVTNWRRRRQGGRQADRHPPRRRSSRRPLAQLQQRLASTRSAGRRRTSKRDLPSPTPGSRRR